MRFLFERTNALAKRVIEERLVEEADAGVLNEDNALRCKNVQGLAVLVEYIAWGHERFTLAQCIAQAADHSSPHALVPAYSTGDCLSLVLPECIEEVPLCS